MLDSGRLWAHIPLGEGPADLGSARWPPADDGPPAVVLLRPVEDVCLVPLLAETHEGRFCSVRRHGIHDDEHRPC